MLVVNVGFTWQAGERGFTAHVPPNFFCFKNNHTDWNCECLQKRYNTAWPFWGEPSRSDHVMLNTAVYRFGGLAGKLCGHYCTYLHTCIHANVADVFSALNIVLNKDMNKVIVYCCCISASELSESCLLLLIIPTTEFAHCSVWQVAYVCQAQNLFYIFSIYLI
jgi:hypothetical protein